MKSIHIKSFIKNLSFDFSPLPHGCPLFIFVTLLFHKCMRCVASSPSPHRLPTSLPSATYRVSRHHCHRHTCDYHVLRHGCRRHACNYRVLRRRCRWHARDCRLSQRGCGSWGSIVVSYGNCCYRLREALQLAMRSVVGPVNSRDTNNREPWGVDLRQ